MSLSCMRPLYVTLATLVRTLWAWVFLPCEGVLGRSKFSLLSLEVFVYLTLLGAKGMRFIGFKEENREEYGEGGHQRRALW